MAGARKSVYFFLLMFFSIVNSLRIVLVGKTGAGKSASGNTILEKEAFVVDDSADALTMSSTRDSAEIAGTQVFVTDTPGLCSTSMDIKQVKKDFEKSINLTVPGPHVFLLVIKLGRFTQEDKSAVEWIQRHFGAEFFKYTMVLFTCADQIKRRSVEEFLYRSMELQDLLDSCDRRYHVFNNEDKENVAQVSELLQKIEKMVNDNGGQHYTHEMYQEAEKKIREEEERRSREEEERRRNADYWENKKTLLTGFVIGAVVILAGHALVKFLINPRVAIKVLIEAVKNPQIKHLIGTTVKEILKSEN